MWLPDFKQPWKFILSSIKGSHVRPFAASLMYLKAWFLFVSSLKTAQCITVYFKTSDRLTAFFKLTLVFRLIYHRSLFTTITIVIIKTSFIIIKKKKSSLSTRLGYRSHLNPYWCRIVPVRYSL